jgi:FAD/FMN-containing dehydrogenase
VIKFAREHDIEFVAAGGRHSVSAASSSEGGIVIDLRNMRNVTVDEAAKTLTVQGGATWADVDTKAAKFGLCTVGGKCLDAIHAAPIILIKIFQVL